MVTYVFDGSFNGILTAIFESYERKQNKIKLVPQDHYITEMFGELLAIHTDLPKSERVWKGLKTKLNKTSQNQFYKAFLSENVEMFQHLFEYALYVFDNPDGYSKNFGNEHVLAITQMAQKVHREKHRMEAFIRFQKGSDHLFYAIVNPDFNVLPLITGHFKNRYADQPWIIYDERRKYGMYYDLDNVHEITFDFKPVGSSAIELNTVTLDEEELLYATLWKDYFKSTNIKERKNMKLHIQHVPKRYWRYLTEKIPDF